MHDVLIVGVPLVAILAGILLNKQEVSSLRPEMVAFRAEMNARLDSIHRDMREFYAEQARHDVRLKQPGASQTSVTKPRGIDLTKIEWAAR